MNRVQRVVILSLVFALAACGPVSVPPASTYTLSNLYDLTTPSHSRSSATILISTPSANPGYTSSQMMYEMVPYKLKAYANNSWVAPPAEMLLPIIAARVSAKGYFKAVATSPFTGITTYRLSTKLFKLEQDFLQPTSKVHFVIQATLIKCATNTIVASRVFMASVPAPGNNPYSGVIAANQAAAQLTKSIADFAVTMAEKS